MGPGMGAVLARAGMQVTLFDVKPEALERAQGMVGIVEGVLDRLEVPVTDGGSLRYETDQAAALAGAEIVVEAIPEQLELKQQVLAEIEGADLRRGDHRVEHLGHPDHEDRRGPRAIPSA